MYFLCGFFCDYAVPIAIGIITLVALFLDVIDCGFRRSLPDIHGYLFTDGLQLLLHDIRRSGLGGEWAKN